MGDGTGRSVTSKVVAILEAFTPDRLELRLTDLCRITGLPVATAHRLCRELNEWGGLERLPTGEYRIGTRLWRLGTLSPRQRRLRETALPYMLDLHLTSQQSVLLAVLDGYEALGLEKVSGRRPVTAISHVGARLPLHATGVGKVLLAYTSSSFQRNVIEQGLPAHTAYTIVLPGTLLQVLAAIRRNGLAFCSEEMTPGLVSVAAPVFARPGVVVAALSIVARLPRLDLHRLAPAVQTAARTLSRELSRDHPWNSAGEQQGIIAQPAG